MLHHMLQIKTPRLTSLPPPASGITLRNFKSYLLVQRLRRENELMTLRGNLVKISYAW